MRSPHAFVCLLWIAALPLVGCSVMPAAVETTVRPVMRVEVAAAPLLAETVVPAPAVAAPEPLSLPPVPAQPAATTGIRKLQLMGRVTLPSNLKGLANARDGVVIGAPVAVIDVMTGKKLGSGTSYYDGSYLAEVPANVGKRPVLVMVDMVDAGTKKPLFPLAAPLTLAPDLTEQTLDVSPVTTAWYALLYRMAAEQLDAPAPNWTAFGPGEPARTLAAMIIGTDPAAMPSFALMVGKDDGLRQAATAADLRHGIQGVVDRMTSGVTTKTK